MAKYDVSHTCGHSQTHQIFGPHKDRDRKVAWLEGTVCSECYRAKKDADREAANQTAAEKNQAAGLPALTGSDRQVAWAESIRLPVCAALAEFEAAYTPDPEFSPAAQEEIGDAVALLVDEVRSRTDAKWWIEEGRELIVDLDDARRYVLRATRERGLIPTAQVEAEAIRDRKDREARERRDADAILADELVTNFRADGLRYDPETQAVTGAIAGHMVHCAAFWVGGAVTVDGRVLCEPEALRSRLREFRDAAASTHYRAAAKARSDALVGATVVGVNKVKQDLTVTLSDGRVLAGKSSREGWELTHEGSSKWANGQTLDPGHPEVERITAEAKAWAKARGVK